VKLIIKDSLLFFIVQCSAILLFASNNFYLIHYSGPEAVAKFNIGYKMMLLLLIPIESIGPYLTPVLNEAILKVDYQWVKKITRQALITSIGLSFIAGLLILTVGNYLLHSWIGPAITLDLIDLIAIAAFTVLFANPGSILSYIMLTSALIRYKIIFYTTAVVLSLVMKYICIKQFGVVGAYWSTSIPMLIVYILPCLIILRLKRYL
jgi:O-antigen/teichoic acid export membrane protein